MTEEVVTKLYGALVEELRRRDHVEERPITVSELYQTLIPYQAVRTVIGVDLNADYEHALLRLLAGERDLLRLEPLTAREELRREVDAPYPFVGLFRKFSASDVWVSMPDDGDAPEQPESLGSATSEIGESAAPDGAAGAAAAGEAGEAWLPIEADTREAPVETEAHVEEVTPAGADRSMEAETPWLQVGGGPEVEPDRPPIHLHSASDSESSEREFHSADGCAFCGEELPVGRRVRFCPYCGGDQRLCPCPHCEAVLERDWRFCISCGQEVGGD